MPLCCCSNRWTVRCALYVISLFVQMHHINILGEVIHDWNRSVFNISSVMRSGAVHKTFGTATQHRVIWINKPEDCYCYYSLHWFFYWLTDARKSHNLYMNEMEKSHSVTAEYTGEPYHPLVRGCLEVSVGYSSKCPSMGKKINISTLPEILNSELRLKNENK